jgi:hypothetical protein
VQRNEIESVLARAEAAVERGETALGPSGFWRVVDAVKRDPDLGAAYADRIAAVDRRAFEQWALVKVPVGLGTALMMIGTLAGFGLVLWAYSLDQPGNGLALLAGTGITLVTTHGLAHQVVGGLFGIRFTHWFIGSIGRPQPGVKIDYRSYLETPARRRAWMHASGAALTKLIPFFALGPAIVMEAPWWTTAILVAIGIGQIATDMLWSTASSDWKRYRREMRIAAGA